MKGARLFLCLLGLILFSVEAWLVTPTSWRTGVLSRSWRTRHQLEQSASSPEESSLLFSDEEIDAIERIYSQVTADKPLSQVLLETLSTLSPKLVLKLRQAEGHHHNSVQKVARGLNHLLQEQLETATQTLKSLLEAGEVRKLDSLIGKAAREGRLDAAFFNVMTINMKDAMRDEPSEEEGAASRLQVLQHIYTRCQEEVEKNLDPGMALLNKLLRTQQDSIRANLYRHYLTPQANTITTPTGQTLELKNTNAATLVSLEQFIKALETAVLQIRTVEQSGGTDRESAAMMVESCRTVAKEARVIIGESYGIDSDELKQFETGLQPVFRPSSPSSPFITGQAWKWMKRR